MSTTKKTEQKRSQGEAGDELMPQESQSSIAILLLAAGSSSRMGQSKQLLSIEGEPLLVRTAKAALQSRAQHTLVVTGANAEEHEAVIHPLPLTIIRNEEWEKGMGSSLKKGLQHLIKTDPDLSAVLVLVCDQALLSASILDELIATYHQQEKRIVASHYAGAPGVPALFDRSVFDQLLQLDGQQGAKKVILANPDQLLTISWPQGETDLDTWEEYLKFSGK